MARKTTAIHDEKIEFRNTTEGWLGVVTYAPNGDERAIAVEPGGKVWLSPAEQELTAKAPKNAADNPFIEQKVPRINPENGEVEGYDLVTPLVPHVEERFIPSGDAPDGTHDAREEVGTPSAQKPAARGRRRAAA